MYNFHILRRGNDPETDDVVLWLFSFTEITAFSDRYAEFEKLNTEILGVSIDSVVRVLSL